MERAEQIKRINDDIKIFVTSLNKYSRKFYNKNKNAFNFKIENMKELLKSEVNSLCSVTYSNLRYWGQNCAESIDYIALVYNEGCEGLPFTELLASAQYRYYLDELMWDYSKLTTINQLQTLLNDLQSQDEE
jgi:hypothetical protein